MTSRRLILRRLHFLFFGSAKAGINSATIYTLMANCKAVGIDPERYLEAALNAMTTRTTPAQAAELTPAKIAEKWRAKKASETTGLHAPIENAA